MPMRRPRNSNWARWEGDVEEGLRIHLSRFSPTPIAMRKTIRMTQQRSEKKA